MKSVPLDDPNREAVRQRLLASMPRREQFDSDEEFEEVFGFWMTRRGRALSQMASQQMRSLDMTQCEDPIDQLTGSILAAWFMANPNGPTIWSIGYVEHPDGPRIFYRWMHFTGEKIWLLGDLTDHLSKVGEEFGKLLVECLLRVQTYFAINGDNGPGAIPCIPSFVVTNGNPDISQAIKTFITEGLVQNDWGRELYYCRKYKADFFGRAGEETRETFEAMRREADPDRQFLEAVWLRHRHIPSFSNWAPGAYESRQADRSIISEWWDFVTDQTTIAQGLDQIAAMWLGSSQQVGPSFHQQLIDQGEYVSLAGVARFFGEFQLPLWVVDR